MIAGSITSTRRASLFVLEDEYPSLSVASDPRAAAHKLEFARIGVSLGSEPVRLRPRGARKPSEMLPLDLLTLATLEATGQHEILSTGLSGTYLDCGSLSASFDPILTLPGPEVIRAVENATSAFAASHRLKHRSIEGVDFLPFVHHLAPSRVKAQEAAEDIVLYFARATEGGQDNWPYGCELHLQTTEEAEAKPASASLVDYAMRHRVSAMLPISRSAEPGNENNDARHDEMDDDEGANFSPSSSGHLVALPGLRQPMGSLFGSILQHEHLYPHLPSPSSLSFGSSKRGSKAAVLLEFDGQQRDLHPMIQQPTATTAAAASRFSRHSVLKRTSSRLSPSDSAAVALLQTGEGRGSASDEGSFSTLESLIDAQLASLASFRHSYNQEEEFAAAAAPVEQMAALEVATGSSSFHKKGKGGRNQQRDTEHKEGHGRLQQQRQSVLEPAALDCSPSSLLETASTFDEEDKGSAAAIVVPHFTSPFEHDHDEYHHLFDVASAKRKQNHVSGEDVRAKPFVDAPQRQVIRGALQVAEKISKGDGEGRGEGGGDGGSSTAFLESSSFLALRSKAMLQASMRMEAYLASRVEGLKMILDPILSSVFKPVAEQVTSPIGEQMNDGIGTNVGQELKADAPGNIAMLLSKALTYNLTNILTDAVPDMVADPMTKKLVAAISEGVKSETLAYAIPRLHDLLVGSGLTKKQRKSRDSRKRQPFKGVPADVDENGLLKPKQPYSKPEIAEAEQAEAAGTGPLLDFQQEPVLTDGIADYISPLLTKGLKRSLIRSLVPSLTTLLSSTLTPTLSAILDPLQDTDLRNEASWVPSSLTITDPANSAVAGNLRGKNSPMASSTMLAEVLARAQARMAMNRDRAYNLWGTEKRKENEGKIIRSCQLCYGFVSRADSAFHLPMAADGAIGPWAQSFISLPWQRLQGNWSMEGDTALFEALSASGQKGQAPPPLSPTKMLQELGPFAPNAKRMPLARDSADCKVCHEQGETGLPAYPAYLQRYYSEFASSYYGQYYGSFFSAAANATDEKFREYEMKNEKAWRKQLIENARLEIADSLRGRGKLPGN